MPQVKGSANWLTNTKQNVGQTRVAIDNSDAHIENDRIGDDMVKRLDGLHLAAHRSMADRDNDVRMAQNEVQKYSRLRSIIKEKLLDKVLQARRSELKEQRTQTSMKNAEAPQFGNNFLLIKDQGQRATSARHQRPQTRLSTATNGFSHIQIEHDTDDVYYKKPRRARAASTPAVTAAAADDKRPPRRRRPRTSYNEARSRRQIREALEQEFSKVGQANAASRAQTSLGFAPNDDGNVNNPTEDKTKNVQPFANIDDLLEGERNQAHTEVMRCRQMHEAEQTKLLQSKIKRFYATLDEFQRENNHFAERKSVVRF